MPSNSSPIPEWLLERFALGELPPLELQALRQRLETDVTAQQRLGDIERSNQAILEIYPTERMARQIEARLRIALARDADESRASSSLSRRGRALLLGAPLFAGAAAVLLLVATPTEEGADRGLSESCVTSDGETVCFKGDPQLVVHRRFGDAQERLEPGASARVGDTLQVSYRAAGRAFGTILSIDGRGTVTVHYPDGPRAGKLDPVNLTALSHSYELDDAPAFEWFFFVAAKEPFAVHEVRAAARSLAEQWRRSGPPAEGAQAELQLPSGLKQTSFRVEKVSR